MHFASMGWSHDHLEGAVCRAQGETAREAFHKTNWKIGPDPWSSILITRASILGRSPANGLRQRTNFKAEPIAASHEHETEPEGR